jgi:exopolysaccharide production negative regulator
MRIAELLLRVIAIGAAFIAAPAMAFDGSKTDSAMAAAPPLTAMEAFRSGAHWLKAGEKTKAIHSLEYAAEKGHALAQWKLGRMYAEGDGVDKNKLRAFKYFRRIANLHADDNPDAPQSRFVASAFVALGRYYLDGIPDTPIKSDPVRAKQMFAYAASYFRDADAQYYLGRLYLNGIGVPKDSRHAARWLRLAAIKGHCQAQALLGSLLFTGDKAVGRQAALGLMWLTLSKDCASSSEAWISDRYNNAMKHANDDERAMAATYLEDWMRNRHE